MPEAICPRCGQALEPRGGLWICPRCGYTETILDPVDQAPEPPEISHKRWDSAFAHAYDLLSKYVDTDDLKAQEISSLISKAQGGDLSPETLQALEDLQ